MSITKTPFGKTKDGQEVSLYTCVNKNGLVLKMTEYGPRCIVERPIARENWRTSRLSFPTLAVTWNVILTLALRWVGIAIALPK